MMANYMVDQYITRHMDYGEWTTVAVAGVYVVLTKQMLLVDEYYMECMDKLNFL